MSFAAIYDTEWTLYTICMQAVCHGQEDLLEDLLQRCTEGQINSLDKQGFAALHYAVKYENVSIIKKLLKAKCGKFVVNILCIHLML